MQRSKHGESKYLLKWNYCSDSWALKEFEKERQTGHWEHFMSSEAWAKQPMIMFQQILFSPPHKHIKFSRGQSSAMSLPQWAQRKNTFSWLERCAGSTLLFSVQMNGNGWEGGLLTYLIMHVNTNRWDFTELLHVFPARKEKSKHAWLNSEQRESWTAFKSTEKVAHLTQIQYLFFEISQAWPNLNIP